MSTKDQNCSFAYHGPPFFHLLPTVHKEGYKKILKISNHNVSRFSVLWQFLKAPLYPVVPEDPWLLESCGSFSKFERSPVKWTVMEINQAVSISSQGLNPGVTLLTILIQ